MGDHEHLLLHQLSVHCGGRTVLYWSSLEESVLHQPIVRDGLLLGFSAGSC